MTKRTVKPPIVDPSLDQSLGASLTDHCDDVVEASMEERSGTLEDALGHDDEQWIDTVLKSLQTRSDQVREALKKALLNGEQNGTPAGLTTFLQQSENDGKPSGKRPPISVVPTIRLHNGEDHEGANPDQPSTFVRLYQGA